METRKTSDAEKAKRLGLREAIDQANAGGGVAVWLDAGPAVITREEAERLEADGTSFAYICVHEGKVVTIPTR